MQFKKYITLLAACCSVLLPQFSYAQLTSEPARIVEETSLKIQHEPTLISVRSDDPIAISATVTAAGAVDQVLLFYRTADADAYQSIPMRPAGNDLYSVVLPSGDAQVPKFEYYIQAKDQQGHTVSRAGAAMPFKVAVTANASTAASSSGAIGLEASAPAPAMVSTQLGNDAPQQDEKKTYLGWILGAVAVGLVLALAGGGGGGGGGDSGPGTSPNPTGTVVIVGPAPAH